MRDSVQDVPISDADRIAIDQWLKNLENDPELRHIAQENEFEDFLQIYEKRLEDQILDSLSDNQPLVSKIFSDVEFKRKITVAVGSFYQKQAKSEVFPDQRYKKNQSSNETTRAVGAGAAVEDMSPIPSMEPSRYQSRQKVVMTFMTQRETLSIIMERIKHIDIEHTWQITLSNTREF